MRQSTAGAVAQRTEGPNLRIDETTVQVLKEPSRDNTTISYVWVARGGPPRQPVLWCTAYEPSSGARVTEDIVGDYQGLRADRWIDGCDSFFAGTSYRAANWIHVGQTQGRAGNSNVHRLRALPKKDIWLYPLTPKFRSRPCAPIERWPSRTSTEREALGVARTKSLNTS